MKQFNVLGLSLRDFSVREAMRRINLYLNNGVCNTIDFVTQDILLKASSSEELKNWIESMDMTVCATADILVAGKALSRSREKEINSNLLLKELLKKLSREGRSIHLISNLDSRMAHLQSSLCSFSPGLNIIGTSIIDGSESKCDAAINEINSSVPDTVIIFLPSPESERFLSENKKRMNTPLSIAIREASLKVTETGNIRTRGIGNAIMRKIFHSVAAKYDKKNSDTPIFRQARNGKIVAEEDFDE